MNTVTWVEKLDETHNPFERITHIGGYNSKGDFSIPSVEAIRIIEKGGYKFGVKIDGKLSQIIVGHHNGKKFLKTKYDRLSPESLLSLPKFSKEQIEVK